MEKAADQLLQKALDNTAKEYAENNAGQGKDLARVTKALASTGASTVETVCGLIEIALEIPNLVIYGYDKIKRDFMPKVSAYLNDVPAEELVEPNEGIAGPILEAVRFKTGDKEISDLFAALLASAMKNSSKDLAHPAYIQIINEITADEAKILSYFANNNLDSYPLLDLVGRVKEQRITSMPVLKHFTDLGYVAGCANPTFIPTYVDNLCRLKLFDVPFGSSLTDKSKYTPLKDHEALKPWLVRVEEWGREPDLLETILHLTPFGSGFIQACKLKQSAN